MATVETTVEIIESTAEEQRRLDEFWTAYEDMKAQQRELPDEQERRERERKALADRLERLREAQREANRLRTIRGQNSHPKDNRAPYENGYQYSKSQRYHTALMKVLDKRLPAIARAGEPVVPMSAVRKEVERRVGPVASAREALVSFTRIMVNEMLGAADGAPSLKIAALKEADNICRAYEKLRDNVKSTGEAAKVEYRQALREDMGEGEIEGTRREQMLVKIDSLRVQWEYFDAKFKGAMLARQDAIDRSGTSWGAYMGYQQLNEMARSRQRMRNAALDTLKGLGPTEYRNRLKQMMHVHLHNDGVDAQGDLVGPTVEDAAAWAKKNARAVADIE